MTVNSHKDKTIAVAMSGGVDSSAVAAMLQAKGYNLIGLTLQLWNQRRLAGREGMPEHVQGRCCSIDDVYDARRVAEDIGIPYYLVNQQERFEQDVVKPFVSEYLAGRTPIPCSLCNNHLKFDQLLLTARQIGADLIATGHYARNEYDPERARWILKRPADTSKGPDVFSIWADPGPARAHALSPRQLHQAAGTRDRTRPPPRARSQARFAGNLLHSRRRLQKVHRRLPRRTGRDAARHSR